MGYFFLVNGFVILALVVSFPILVFGLLKYESFRHSRIALMALPFSAYTVIAIAGGGSLGFRLVDYISPLYVLVFFLIGALLMSFKLAGASMKETGTALLCLLLPPLFLIVMYLCFRSEALQSHRKEYWSSAFQFLSVFWATWCHFHFGARRVHRLWQEGVKSGKSGDGPRAMEPPL